MKNRKTILLTAIGVLAAIYALQTVLSSRSPVKLLKLKEKPDVILIEKEGKQIKLTMEGGLWYLGDDKKPADDNKAAELVEAVTSIKVLASVSHSSSDAELNRYGLSDGQTIKVSANKGEKPLRSIVIGKNASSESQTFIQLDGSSETVLAGGSIRSAFTVDEESLKLKVQENAPDGASADLSAGQTPAEAQSKEGAANL